MLTGLFQLQLTEIQPQIGLYFACNEKVQGGSLTLSLPSFLSSFFFFFNVLIYFQAYFSLWWQKIILVVPGLQRSLAPMILEGK